MNSTLENKIWNYIYNEVGVHPDDYSIDFSSVEACEASLKSEGLGEWKLPRSATPDLSFHDWCVKAVKNSILVDKDVALSFALKSRELRRQWADCDCPDMPRVDNTLLSEVVGPNSTMVVV